MENLPAIREIYRRFKQRQQLLDWFEPFPYQQEAYLSTKPIQLIEGSNRSGKTHLAVAKIINIALGTHPTVKRLIPMKIRVIGTVMQQGALGVIMDKFRDLLPYIQLKHGSWEKAFRPLESKLYLRNGTTIQFMSDSQDIQTHRGESIDVAMIDEECKEEIFDETLTRLADRSGMLILSMTAHNGMTWSYKKLVKASRYNKDIGYYHLDVMQNVGIDRKSWIKKAAATFNDNQFAIRIKGQRISNEGLVYYMFNDQTHVMQSFELPKESQLFLGVDFGLQNPHAGSLWAITPDGKMYVVDEYYVTGKTVEENGLAQGKWVKENWGDYRLRWVSCDPMSGTQRNEQTNEQNIHVYKKAFWEGYGKAVPVLPGNRDKGAVEHRINKMREYLTPDKSGLPELMIFSNCINHLAEIEEYVFATRKDENMNMYERPKAAHNHLMNACEYIAERSPAYMVPVKSYRESHNIELQYGCIGR